MRLFKPILPGAAFSDRLLACIGAAVGIALTSLICSLAAGFSGGLPLFVAPMGASAVLVFAVPASPLAQPWPVLGGNVVSALVGVAATHAIADPAVAAGVAVGGAILAMSLLRCLHPPGGAVALTTVIGGPVVASAGFLFPFMPVAVNSLVLLATAAAFHSLSRRPYPHRPHPAAVPAKLPRLAPEAVDRAIADMGEAFDISRVDLDLLLQRAELHAQTMAQTAKPR